MEEHDWRGDTTGEGGKTPKQQEKRGKPEKGEEEMGEGKREEENSSLLPQNNRKKR